jgi:hypothetical protein
MRDLVSTPANSTQEPTLATLARLSVKDVGHARSE